MCRNIHRLRRNAPPVDLDEIYDSSFHLAKKVAGYAKPSQKRLPTLASAASDIQSEVIRLLENLEIEGKKPCVEILKN